MQSRRFYDFGPFRLDADEKTLFRGSALVALPPKDVETLAVLVRNAPEVVGKADLIRAVWHDTFVEEGNLARHVSSLRQVLGEQPDGAAYIETVPKRGYRFAAAMRPVAPEVDGPRVQPPAPRPGAPPRRTGGIGLVAALAGVCALGVVGWRTARTPPALPFDARDLVLLADFENETGDPRFDRALLTALTVSLEQSPHANVFPRSRVDGALRRMGKDAGRSLDESTARELCQREGIRGLVASSITRTGHEYALAVRLIDPRTGAAVRSHAERAHSEDGILDALDRLARHVRRDLGESLASIRAASRPLPQVTTASLEALRAYAEGRDLWREGRYGTAAESWATALRLDPDFAMAHKDLGTAHAGRLVLAGAEPGRGRHHLERALALTSRVTDRERAAIQAAYHDALGTYEDASRAYDDYLRIYPDDARMQLSAANQRMHAGRLEEAAERFREVIRISPSDPHAHVNLGTCLALGGRHREALPHYARAFELSPSLRQVAHLNHEYGFVLVGAGERAQARALFEGQAALSRAELRAGALRSLALLDALEGRGHDAALRLREAIALQGADDLALSRARNHLLLALLAEASGDGTTVRRELDAAAQESLTVWLASRVGAAYARQGALAEAARMLEVTRRRASPDHPADASDVHRLEGELALARGRHAEALERLALAHQEHPRLLTLEAQARAHARAGHADAALDAYRQILDAKEHWLGWEAQFVRQAAEVQLARSRGRGATSGLRGPPAVPPAASSGGSGRTIRYSCNRTPAQLTSCSARTGPSATRAGRAVTGEPEREPHVLDVRVGSTRASARKVTAAPEEAVTAVAVRAACRS